MIHYARGGDSLPGIVSPLAGIDTKKGRRDCLPFLYVIRSLFHSQIELLCSLLVGQYTGLRKLYGHVVAVGTYHL